MSFADFHHRALNHRYHLPFSPLDVTLLHLQAEKLC